MSGSTILLVEDNAMDVELARRAFGALPHAPELIVGRDGEAVLAWIPRWQAGDLRPALILLDLKLPQISGLEVLRVLKATPVSRPIPVVVLSTSKVPEDVEAAYAAGANSYLTKPTNYDDFVQLATTAATYWARFNIVASG